MSESTVDILNKLQASDTRDEAAQVLVDRYMTQLLSQKFGTTLKDAGAILLGDFSRCEEPGDPDQNAVCMIRDRVFDSGLPCGTGVAVGHGRRNRAFPFGGRARLAVDGLRLLEPATAQ